MEDKYIRKNRIAEALAIRNMKQVELCERTGIKKASVNGWVKNNWQPKQEALYKMSKTLDVSEMWLAGYDVPMERKKETIERPDIILEHDNHTYFIDLKGSGIDCTKICNLFDNLLELNPDQLATIESLVKQLNKLNEKE